MAWAYLKPWLVRDETMYLCLACPMLDKTGRHGDPYFLCYRTRRGTRTGLRRFLDFHRRCGHHRWSDYPDPTEVIHEPESEAQEIF